MYSTLHPEPYHKAPEPPQQILGSLVSAGYCSKIPREYESYSPRSHTSGRQKHALRTQKADKLGTEETNSVKQPRYEAGSCLLTQESANQSLNLHIPKDYRPYAHLSQFPRQKPASYTSASSTAINTNPEASLPRFSLLDIRGSFLRDPKNGDPTTRG